jgi:uncharacterized membrane protein YagU involved in acid resistance
MIYEREREREIALWLRLLTGVVGVCPQEGIKAFFSPRMPILSLARSVKEEEKSIKGK